VRLEEALTPAQTKVAQASPAGILDAGEGAHIARDGRIVRETLNLAEVATWRQRRLVFREETLANIAAEFNRYNRSPHIAIEGEATANTRYGGTFDADDPESLAQFVETRGQLTVRREPGRIVILGTAAPVAAQQRHIQ
jgi:transmembrane sensor